MAIIANKCALSLALWQITQTNPTKNGAKKRRHSFNGKFCMSRFRKCCSDFVGPKFIIYMSLGREYAMNAACVRLSDGSTIDTFKKVKWPMTVLHNTYIGSYWNWWHSIPSTFIECTKIQKLCVSSVDISRRVDTNSRNVTADHLHRI